jgi:hypothetical protein
MLCRCRAHSQNQIYCGVGMSEAYTAMKMSIAQMRKHYNNAIHRGTFQSVEVNWRREDEPATAYTFPVANDRATNL